MIYKASNIYYLALHKKALLPLPYTSLSAENSSYVFSSLPPLPSLHLVNNYLPISSQPRNHFLQEVLPDHTPFPVCFPSTLLLYHNNNYKGLLVLPTTL